MLINRLDSHAACQSAAPWVSEQAGVWLGLAQAYLENKSGMNIPDVKTPSHNLEKSSICSGNRESSVQTSRIWGCPLYLTSLDKWLRWEELWLIHRHRLVSKC